MASTKNPCLLFCADIWITHVYCVIRINETTIVHCWPLSAQALLKGTFMLFTEGGEIYTLPSPAIIFPVKMGIHIPTSNHNPTSQTLQSSNWPIETAPTYWHNTSSHLPGRGFSQIFVDVQLALWHLKVEAVMDGVWTTDKRHFLMLLWRRFHQPKEVSDWTMEADIRRDNWTLELKYSPVCSSDDTDPSHTCTRTNIRANMSYVDIHARAYTLKHWDT